LVVSRFSLPTAIPIDTGEHIEDRLFTFIVANVCCRNTITGNVGSDEYNMRLSETRSKSVADYLISKGVSANRIVAKGYGETKPRSENDSEAGRQNNRRTEFRILSK